VRGKKGSERPGQGEETKTVPETMSASRETGRRKEGHSGKRTARFHKSREDVIDSRKRYEVGSAQIRRREGEQIGEKKARVSTNGKGRAIPKLGCF